MNIKDHSKQHPLIKKINELHCQINKYNTKINSLMKKTLMDLIKSESTKEFLKENEKNYKVIDDIYDKLIECVYTIQFNKNGNIIYTCNYESDDFDDLILMINKTCNIYTYNKNIINKINDDIDYLISVIKIDKNIIKKVNDDNNNEQFYLKIMRFLDLQDLLKVFRIIPENMKTYSVCKIALSRESNIIKYIDDQTEDICDIAIMMGHTNLNDIRIKNRTMNICKKYVDIDINNIQYITHSSNLPESFFVEYIEKNPAIFKLLDKSCITPRINRLIVSKNGTMIRYIPSNFQTVALIELAEKQNPNSVYYVIYDIPIFFKKDKFVEIMNMELNNLKKICNGTKIERQMDDIHNLINTNAIKMSFDNGIIIDLDINGVKFFVMTLENYINHEHICELEKKYECDFSVLVEKSPLIITKTHKKNVKTQYITKFYDDDKNGFVMFFDTYENY